MLRRAAPTRSGPSGLAVVSSGRCRPEVIRRRTNERDIPRPLRVRRGTRPASASTTASGRSSPSTPRRASSRAASSAATAARRSSRPPPGSCARRRRPTPQVGRRPGGVARGRGLGRAGREPDAEMGSIEAVLPRRSAFSRVDPGRARPGTGPGGQPGHGHRRPPDRPRAQPAPDRARARAGLGQRRDAGRRALEGGRLRTTRMRRSRRSAGVAMGVDVLLTSATTGLGMDEVAAYAEGHRTVAFIGPSGAGKSTLINELVGGDVQAVAEVRAFDGKGRHTTVARELVPLPNGGVLVDTPGLRSAGAQRHGRGRRGGVPGDRRAGAASAGSTTARTPPSRAARCSLPSRTARSTGGATRAT